MNSVIITPKKLNGIVNIPPSRSLSTRAVICASFARGISEIDNISDSSDVNVVIKAMQSLGAKITKSNNKLIVDGRGTYTGGANHAVDCETCTTAFMFLIPLALHGDCTTFTCDGSLTDYTVDTYISLFEKSGVSYSSNGSLLPVTVQKGDISGIIELSHKINSQFLSGLLLSLPLYPYDSIIHLDAPFQAKSHIDITLDVMKKFGVRVQNIGYQTFRIHGGQMYQPSKYRVEGDYAKAAFFLAAGAIGNFAICRGLPKETKQSDKAILTIIEKFGGKIVYENGDIAAIPSPLFGRGINISETPDLLPAVTLLGMFAKGETVISGVDHLETQRLTLIAEQFNNLGATIIEKSNGLIIEGSSTIAGGSADSCDNFKLAMAIAIASTCAKNSIELDNTDCIIKSYRDFWDDFIGLGGIVN